MALLPTYSNEIKFTTSLQSQLRAMGIAATNFEEWILEVSSKSGVSQSQLDEAVSSITGDSMQVTAKTYGIKSGAQDMVKIQDRVVEYEIHDKNLTYNFDKLLGNVPEGVVHLGSRVDVVSDTGKKSSVKGSKAVVPIPAFPATVNFSAEFKTANGPVTLEKSVYVEGESSKIQPLDIKDLSNAPANLSPNQAFDLLFAEIALLKQR